MQRFAQIPFSILILSFKDMCTKMTLGPQHFDCILVPDDMYGYLPPRSRLLQTYQWKLFPFVSISLVYLKTRLELELLKPPPMRPNVLVSIRLGNDSSRTLCMKLRIFLVRLQLNLNLLKVHLFRGAPLAATKKSFYFAEAFSYFQLILHQRAHLILKNSTVE